MICLDDLVKLRYQAKSIRFNHHRRVSTATMGKAVSLAGTRGLDFREVREYQRGDEIRYLDWRVTARTGKPHTKVFCEDRERPVFLIVDLNPSMFFGTRVTFKSVVAAHAAALIAWAAAENHDRVGGLVFSGHQRIEVKPRAGLQGVLPFLKSMTSPPSVESHPHALLDAISHFQPLVKRGCLVVVLSDFYGLNSESEKAIGEMSAHYSVVLGSVFDALEKNPPPPEQYAVMQGDRIAQFDSSDTAFCKNYVSPFEARAQTLQLLSRRYRLPLVQLATDCQVASVLNQVKL